MVKKDNSKSKDFKTITDLGGKIIVMGIGMLVAFVFQSSSLFFISHIASKQTDKTPIMNNSESEYFIELGQEQEPDKERQSFKGLFDRIKSENYKGEGTGFYNTVFTKNFKIFDEFLYAKLSALNAYDKLYGGSKIKLLSTSFMVFYILPFILFFAILFGNLFFMFMGGFSYYALNAEKGYDIKGGNITKSLEEFIDNLDNEVVKLPARVLHIPAFILSVLLYGGAGLIAGFGSMVYGTGFYLVKTFFRIYLNPLFQSDLFTHTDMDSIDPGGKLKNTGQSFFAFLLNNLMAPFLLLYCINVAIMSSTEISSNPLMYSIIGLSLVFLYGSFFMKRFKS
jgi:hypothetical protein